MGAPRCGWSGTETVGTQPRTVRSTHIYADRSEVVVEALAPPDVFGQADSAACSRRSCAR